MLSLKPKATVKTDAVPIVVLGHGNIGQQFLQILCDNQHKIVAEIQQPVWLLAVANSRTYGIDDGAQTDQIITLNQQNSNNELFAALSAWRDQPLVIIDVTASDEVAQSYPDFARNGWHIISANKVAAADDRLASETEDLIRRHGRLWLKNTTVGASLPVQSSIQLLQASGDEIKSVSGVFSGSLSWLFGRYDGAEPFMDWVRKAHQRALTEPDPRDDLSGLDVFRKAKILARELGFEPTKISFDPVIPDDLLGQSEAEFWGNEAAINQHLDAIWREARANNQSLRYLAEVNADELRVGLTAVGSSHPSASLKPSDNLFIIETEWYGNNPLVIQGPGAGREVTAAGVLTDLIQVLQSR